MIIQDLIRIYPELSKALRGPAKYMIDNPGEIGVNSMRRLARLSNSTPNALMRLARILRFHGFSELQEPFRQAIREGGSSIPNRARWLQALNRGGKDEALLAQMAQANLNGIGGLFSNLSPDELKAAAQAIIRSRMTYVMGVRGAYSLAHNFYYVARMAIKNVTLVPSPASSVVDDIIGVGKQDVVIAISLSPYAADTVEAFQYAKTAGARLLGITDSRASPLARIADHVFLTPSSTPQFFNSIVASAAFLEVLLAFIVASGSDDMLSSIKSHDRLRYENGTYWLEQSGETR